MVSTILEKLIKVKRRQLKLNSELTALDKAINKLKPTNCINYNANNTNSVNRTKVNSNILTKDLTKLPNVTKSNNSVNANNNSLVKEINKLAGLKLNKRGISNMLNYYANRYRNPNQYRGM